MAPAGHPFGLPRPSLLAALLWLPPALALTLATPWVGRAPAPVVLLWNLLPPVITVLLICWNLAAAVAIVGRTGRAHLAGPCTVALLALFTLLFFQIACHLGAEHYQWERSPQWWDWLLFSGVHALRAGDLFDFLEAYGINLQVIHHHGVLVASFLCAFHLILGVFFISVLFEYVRELLSWVRATRQTPDGVRPLTARGRLFLALVLAGLASVGIHAALGSLGGMDLSGSIGSHVLTILLLIPVLLPLLRSDTVPPAISGRGKSGWRQTLLVLGLFYLIALVVSAIWLRPWRTEDLYLWPIENLLHVLDVGDALHLFRWHLSQVPHGTWEGSLTFICRLVMGLALGGLLGWLVGMLSLRLFGGYGLRPEELEHLERTTTSQRLRQVARERLRRIRTARVPAHSHGWGWGLLVLGGLASLAVAAPSLSLPGWDRAARRLGTAAVAGDEQALEALRRMGPAAGSVAGNLSKGLPEMEPGQRRRLFETLAYLGPEGLSVLGDLLEEGSPDLARACLSVLETRGEIVAPTLARGMVSTSPEVARAAEETIVRLGRSTMPHLIATLTYENARYHAQLFERVDPQYWFGHPSGNPVYRELVGESTILLTGPTDTVRNRGWSNPSLARVLRRLRDAQPSVREQARIDLGRINRFKPEEFLQLLDFVPDAAHDEDQTLKRVLRDRVDSVTNTRELVTDSETLLLPLVRRRFLRDPERIISAGDVLYRMFPAWQQRPETWPIVVEATRHTDRWVRLDAVMDLGKVGRAGAALAVPVLIERLTLDSDPEAAAAAARSLGQLGPAAGAALPALRQTALRGNPEARLAADQAIAKIQP